MICSILDMDPLRKSAQNALLQKHSAPELFCVLIRLLRGGSSEKMFVKNEVFMKFIRFPHYLPKYYLRRLLKLTISSQENEPDPHHSAKVVC